MTICSRLSEGFVSLRYSRYDIHNEVWYWKLIHVSFIPSWPTFKPQPDENSNVWIWRIDMILIKHIYRLERSWIAEEIKWSGSWWSLSLFENASKFHIQATSLSRIWASGNELERRCEKVWKWSWSSCKSCQIVFTTVISWWVNFISKPQNLKV